MKITVVTVCYNAESVLKKTFNSVLNQEYGDYEYVVIDGNSTDNTVNIIKEYKRKFEKRDIEFRYISEPDKGIYDAMNKAIKIAEGEWIYFLNAGDYLFSNDTFKEIFAEEKNDDADIVYGKVMKKTDHGNELRSHDPVETIVKELPFCHQGVFTKTEIMKAELFDCKYSMCADYDFFLNMYLQGKKFKKIESMVAYYQMGGLSDVNYFKTLKESYRIKSTRGVLKFGDKVYWKLYYIPATWFHLKKVSLKNKKKGLDMMKKLKIIYRKIYNLLCGNHMHKSGVNVECKNAKLKNNKVICKGKDNKIIIGNDTFLKNCRFHLYGDNNELEIGNGGTFIDVDFWLEDDNNKIVIGDNSNIFGQTQLACTEGRMIRIGKECLFSNEIVVRTGDSHSIYNNKNERINDAKDTVIGNKVWVGNRVLILKGTNIGDGSVVGSGSVCTGKSYGENNIIAGNPAKVIKEDISWSGER